MSEHEKSYKEVIAKLYDTQAESYSQFADNGFSWNYIEKPAFDRYLQQEYQSARSVLDIGCGTGRVIRHLIDRGIAEEQIVGIDISEKLLEQAQKQFPKATFHHASADDFHLSHEQFDLVTANMVFHYLDNEMLLKSLNNIYDVLRPKGMLFHIEQHPLHNEEAVKGENNNTWLPTKTPWGETVYTFNRDLYDRVDIFDLGGFSFRGGWETLPVSDAGKHDPQNYERYTNKYSRVSYKWQKVDPERKRFNNEPIIRIPDLIGGYYEVPNPRPTF
jgi:ubiquinone/menaquinone biosynthesis C-methylase UbiE